MGGLVSATRTRAPPRRPQRPKFTASREDTDTMRRAAGNVPESTPPYLENATPAHEVSGESTTASESSVARDSVEASSASKTPGNAAPENTLPLYLRNNPAIRASLGSSPNAARAQNDASFAGTVPSGAIARAAFAPTRSEPLAASAPETVAAPAEGASSAPLADAAPAPAAATSTRAASVEGQARKATIGENGKGQAATAKPMGIGGITEKSTEEATNSLPSKDSSKAGVKGSETEAQRGVSVEHGETGRVASAQPTKRGGSAGSSVRTRGGGGGGAATAPASTMSEAGGSGGGAGASGEVVAADAGSDAAQEQAQDNLEGKLEHATPEHEGESEGLGTPETLTTQSASPSTPEGLAQASDAADMPTPPITGEDADSGSEGAAGDAAVLPSEPAMPEPRAASDTTHAPADPEALVRASEQVEARESQRDTQRMAESAHAQREQDQAEAQADAGEAPSGAGELSGSEHDTGLGAIGEPVEGGGGGEAAGIGDSSGAAQPVPEPEPAPDTASGDPESGFAAASTLQPMQALQSLNGVGTSIDNTSKAEGESLQSQIPAVEVGGDGSGGTAVVSAPAPEGASGTEDMTNGAEQPTPEPEPTPEPGPAPTEGIAVPTVSDTQEGTVRREDAEAVAGSVDSMPTADPSIDTSAGPPPVLAKTDAADPSQMQDQHAELDATVAQQSAQGATDVAQPAGENQVRDRTPRVALKAPKLAAPATGAAGATVADDEAIGIVAEEQQGDEVRAAMARAQGDTAAKRSEHQSRVTEEKSRSDAEISALKVENAAQQQAEKSKVSAEVGKARADWSAEQNAEVRKTNDKAAKEIAKGNEDITKEEAKGNENANREIAKGEADAQAEKDKAENEAAEKKREAQRKKEEDSGGIFGWIASKVTAFFSALKDAITKVFDAAKALVKKAIDAAKKLAVAAIEAARKVVVGLIKAVGKALIALGDVLLAAFPNLKKKWRSFIESKVKAAEDAVNRLADALKKGVTKLLDALGKAFEFLLDAYKKAMLAVLDVAKGVAMAAIKAAKAIADLVGTFVVLIKDIARGPMDWLSKLGAAAVDGIKNHLWKAFQRDVKQWFNAKLEEVLGLGTTVWNVLKSGGIKMAEVGNMAFEALKAAIPVALVQLLIEKLVAMIVPAAGAVMAIIEGLQAAWGTVQRILSALGKFVAFLKAVKSGGAGPQFADMLSAAGIVVIDFVANWLLKRLRGPASKVSGKIKAIAQKIMSKIKSAAKKIGGTFKKVVAKIKGAFKKGKTKFSDWRAKRKANRRDKKGKDTKEDASKKKQNKEAQKHERLRKALAIIQPAIEGMASGKPFSRLVLKARLLAWRLRFRLTKLSLKAQGTQLQLDARINPIEQRVLALLNADPVRARNIIYEIAKDLFNSRAARRKLAAIAEQKAAGKGENADEPILVSGPGTLPALARWRRQKEAKGEFIQFGKGGGTAHIRRTFGGSHDYPGKQWVAGAGKWRDVDTHFDEMAGTGGTRQGAASQLLRALRGQAPTSAYEGTADPIARQALLIATEGSRSSPNIVMLPEMVADVAEGRVQKPSASLGSDKSPPAAEGDAVKTMRETDRRIGEEHAVGKAHKEPPSDVRVNQVISQQINFLADRIVIGIKTKQLTFKDDAQLRRFIKNELQEWLQSQTEAKLL